MRYADILSFLSNSVSKIFSSHIDCYEVRDNYSEYVSKEKILQVIDDELKANSLTKINSEALRRVAAFYLKSHGEVDHLGRVTQDKVDAIIDKWKKQEQSI